MDEKTHKTQQTAGKLNISRHFSNVNFKQFVPCKAQILSFLPLYLLELSVRESKWKFINQEWQKMYKVYAFHINSRVKQIDEFRYCRNIGPLAMIVQVCL